MGLNVDVITGFFADTPTSLLQEPILVDTSVEGVGGAEGGDPPLRGK